MLNILSKYLKHVKFSQDDTAEIFCQPINIYEAHEDISFQCQGCEDRHSSTTDRLIFFFFILNNSQSSETLMYVVC